MTQNEIILQLRSLMQKNSQVAVNWNSVDASSAIASLGFDSLSILDLIYDIQQHFKVEFDAEEMARVDTVGKLAAFLEAKLRP
jgi:acyl carrier protein